MVNIVFVCKKCHRGYLYSKSEGSSKICEFCPETSILSLEDWETFECSKCKTEYQVLQLQLLGNENIIYDDKGNIKEKRPPILEHGILLCKKDQEILHWIPDNDDEGILNQEFELDEDAWDDALNKDFEIKKIEEQKFEAIILKALKDSKEPSTDLYALKRDIKGLTPKISPTPISSSNSAQISSNNSEFNSDIKNKLPSLSPSYSTPFQSPVTPNFSTTSNPSLKQNCASENNSPTPTFSNSDNFSISNLESKNFRKSPSFSESQKSSNMQSSLNSMEITESSVFVSESSENSESINYSGNEVDSNQKLSIIEPSGMQSTSETKELDLDKEKSSNLSSSLFLPPIYLPDKGWHQPFLQSPDVELEERSSFDTANVESEDMIPSLILEGDSVFEPASLSSESNPFPDLSLEQMESDLLRLKSAEPEILTPFADQLWSYYFSEGQISNPEKYLGGNEAEQIIIGLLNEVNEILLNPDLIDISQPIEDKLLDGKVYYVGDTHGSIIDTDLCIHFFVQQIIQAETSQTGLKIIFDGDYVDRNPMDIHNVLYIFSFALKYSKYVKIMRGNHEELTINSNYGFRRNLGLYFKNPALFDLFETTFANLPLIHILSHKDKRIMTVHGGLPIYDLEYNEMPEIPNFVENLDSLDSRYIQIDDIDEVSQQILWNDPAEDLPPDMFILPSRRGIGFNFGERVFNEWIKVNHVDRVIRAHEVFLSGHKEFFNNRLFSLFSSSDYGGRKIKAKILEIDFTKEWDENWRHLTIRTDLNS